MEPLLEGALTIRGRHAKVNHNELALFYHKEANRIEVFRQYNTVRENGCQDVNLAGKVGR